MEKHLKHLKYLEGLLVKEAPQTNEWWNIKNKLDQVRISWGQSWNLAGVTPPTVLNYDLKDTYKKEFIEEWQRYFYAKLTEPLEEELKETIKKSKRSAKEKLLDTNV